MASFFLPALKGCGDSDVVPVREVMELLAEVGDHDAGESLQAFTVFFGVYLFGAWVGLAALVERAERSGQLAIAALLCSSWAFLWAEESPWLGIVPVIVGGTVAAIVITRGATTLAILRGCFALLGAGWFTFWIVVAAPSDWRVGIWVSWTGCAIILGASVVEVIKARRPSGRPPLEAGSPSLPAG